MITSYHVKLGYKIWLELYDELGRNPIIGEQKINLLTQIQEAGSIQKAADELDLDFKKAHDILNDLQNSFTTDKLFNSERGRQGGTNITLLTRSLIGTYNILNSIMGSVVSQINECLSIEDVDLLSCLAEKNLRSND